MDSEQPSSTTNAISGEITGAVRLLNHVRENNVSYLVGFLVAYQIGILDKVFTYGAGVCV